MEENITDRIMESANKISEHLSERAAFPTWSVVVVFLLIIFVTIYCIRRFVCRKPNYEFQPVALGMSSKDSFNEDRKQSVWFD